MVLIVKIKGKRVVLLAYSGWRMEMLLNRILYKGQSPQHRIIPYKMSIVLRLRNNDLDSYKGDIIPPNLGIIKPRLSDVNS